MKLDDYVKLELLEKEEPRTIKKIWVEYHRNQDCISSVIEPKIFNELVPRTNERLNNYNHIESIYIYSTLKIVLYLLFHYQEKNIMKQC